MSTVVPAAKVAITLKSAPGPLRQLAWSVFMNSVGLTVGVAAETTGEANGVMGTSVGWAGDGVQRRGDNGSRLLGHGGSLIHGACGEVAGGEREKESARQAEVCGSDHS